MAKNLTAHPSKPPGNILLASGELVANVTLPQKGQIPITWTALLPLQSAFMGSNRSLDREKRALEL